MLGLLVLVGVVSLGAGAYILLPLGWSLVAAGCVLLMFGVAGIVAGAAD